MNEKGTKLLVSVRNAQEALTALESGVHLIDVKEPNRGSLGAADPRTIGEVLRAVARRKPVSAALGELQQLPTMAGDIPRGLQYAKVGLAGCSKDLQWPARWIAVCESIRRSAARPVAVVYADWRSVDAPSPDEVLQNAKACGVETLLVDTFDKTKPSLTQQWTMKEISSLVDAVHRQSMEIVLAGKISLKDAVELKTSEADYVAVRSAVCRPDRNGALDGGLVRQLLRELG